MHRRKDLPPREGLRSQTKKKGIERLNKESEEKNDNSDSDDSENSDSEKLEDSQEEIDEELVFSRSSRMIRSPPPKNSEKGEGGIKTGTSSEGKVITKRSPLKALTSGFSGVRRVLFGPTNQEKVEAESPGIGENLADAENIFGGQSPDNL